MTVILAAGALFTAVYDVIQSMDLSHTKIVSAATVDNTGKNHFGVEGTVRNGAGETTTMSFTSGTYMVLFGGAGAGHNIDWGYYSQPAGAVCLAFYKGGRMTVVTGMGGGKSNAYHAGRGKTTIATNFALPTGYTGELTAIAGGTGGGGTVFLVGRDGTTTDGTFAGWEANYDELKAAIGTSYTPGLPATQSHGGYRADGVISPNARDDGYGLAASGGGAGYYDGGAGYNFTGGTGASSQEGGCYMSGGGGSCTPWCYPVFSNDIQNGPTYNGAAFTWYDNYNKKQRTSNLTGVARHLLSGYGQVLFYKIDPTVMPRGGTVAYGETVRLVKGGVGAYTPVTAVQNIPSHSDVSIDNNMGRHLRNYDCGIRAGWVYSVEKGGGWEGLAPDGERSETSGTQ